MDHCVNSYDDKTGKISKYLDILQRSPTAVCLLKEVSLHDWHFELSHELGDGDVYLDMDERHMVLFANTPSNEIDYGLLTNFVSALRDIAHEERHGGFYRDYSSEDALMLSRVRMADCDVISILVAWELRTAGLHGLWRSIIASDKGDLALTFFNSMERYALSGPAVKARNRSLLNAFDQWFADEDRVSHADHQILNDMDDLMISAECHIFNVQTPIKPLMVEVLSCLPDKTAYLRNYGAEILNKPLYAGLSDPINQVHFMQITRDLNATCVAGISFRDETLAARIFPD